MPAATVTRPNSRADRRNEVLKKTSSSCPGSAAGVLPAALPKGYFVTMGK